MLKDNVNTAALCQFFHDIHKILFVVIDEMMGAEFFRLLKFFIASGSRNDFDTYLPGYLNRGDSDPASPTLNENGLPFLSPARVKSMW